MKLFALAMGVVALSAWAAEPEPLGKGIAVVLVAADCAGWARAVKLLARKP
jgi:hypothetical protein